MKRLLLDEMLSGEIATQTKLSGIDALALVTEVELRGMPDSKVLELARSQSRILVTANIRDFEFLNILWLAEARIHSGILYINSKAYRRNLRFPLTTQVTCHYYLLNSLETPGYLAQYCAHTFDTRTKPHLALDKYVRLHQKKPRGTPLHSPHHQSRSDLDHVLGR